jgi:serine/threonine-protein kinase
VNHLEVTLRVGEKTALRKRSTDDPEVYNLYLKGLYFAARTSPEALEKALVFFRKALDRDPNYAPAYAGIARVFASKANMSFAPATEMWPKAKAALDKALSLDQDLAEAHALVAAMAFYFEWDWPEAEASFCRCLALNPGNAFARGIYAWFLLSRRRFEEAVREVRQAVALDPLMPLFHAWAVGIPAAAGMPDEALREFARAVEIDPGNGLAYFHAGIAHMQKGQFDWSIEALEQAGRLGISPEWTERNIGVAYRKKGDLDKARKVFRGLAAASVTVNPSFGDLAFWAAAQGDFDRAFEFFKRACEIRDPLMPFVHIYIDLYAPELRRDPRFGRLISDLNLADVD